MSARNDSTRFIYLYTEHQGQRYRVEIEIRVDDMAAYLAACAVRNRTKRTRMAFATAKARPVKPESE